jgi:MFS family permease
LSSFNRSLAKFKQSISGQLHLGIIDRVLRKHATTLGLDRGYSAALNAATLTLTNGTNSIMQLSTEPAMRGRVMALRVGIALGGTPIGAPIIGWVANHFGPRWALGIGAGAGFTAALVQPTFWPAEKSHCSPSN